MAKCRGILQFHFQVVKKPQMAMKFQLKHPPKRTRLMTIAWSVHLGILSKQATDSKPIYISSAQAKTVLLTTENPLNICS